MITYILILLALLAILIIITYSYHLIKLKDIIEEVENKYKLLDIDLQDEINRYLNK